VQVAPNPVTGDSARVVIRADANVAPGTYSLTLNASASGIAAEQLPLQLQVLSPAPLAITVPFCDAVAPIWVAFQDGDGTWTRAAGEANGGVTRFRKEFLSPRGGIATVSPLLNGSVTVLRVLYGTPTEISNEGDTLHVECDAVAAKTWRGHVDGLAATEKALVGTGLDFRVSVVPTRAEFELIGVRAGPQDVLVSRTALQGSGTALTGFILRREVNAADGAELSGFNFNSPEAFAPVNATMSIVGANATSLSSITELRTRNSRLTLPFISETVFGESFDTREYVALPESRLQPGDLQAVRLSANGATGVSRTSEVYFRSPADRTVFFGGQVSSPTLVTESGGPSLRLRALFDANNDYKQSASLVLSQTSVPAIVSITQSATYSANTNGAFDMTVPDLSAVAGFQSVWALRTNTAVAWAATRTGGTVPVGRNVLPVDGDVRRTALVQGVK
jgi:hypothetical protein